MTEQRHTPGPWTVARMVNEAGDPMTVEEIGTYVMNSVRVTAEKSGTTDFLFVFADTEDGDGHLDICHVGNGPKGPDNARLIAAAPELLEALRKLRRTHHRECEDSWYSCPKSGDCVNDAEDPDYCNCGVDDDNAIIDAAIQAATGGAS